jgi:hypothetical protein
MNIKNEYLKQIKACEEALKIAKRIYDNYIAQTSKEVNADSFKDFFDKKITKQVSKEFKYTTKEVYTLYTSWCKKNNKTAITKLQFNQNLKKLKLGDIKKNSKGTCYYKNITIN